MRLCDGVCAPVCGSLEGTDRMPLPGSFPGFGQGFSSLRRQAGESPAALSAAGLSHLPAVQAESAVSH